MFSKEERENHHLQNTTVIIVSLRNHQWLLQRAGKHHSRYLDSALTHTMVSYWIAKEIKLMKLYSRGTWQTPSKCSKLKLNVNGIDLLRARLLIECTVEDISSKGFSWQKRTIWINTEETWDKLKLERPNNLVNTLQNFLTDYGCVVYKMLTFEESYIWILLILQAFYKT